MSLWPHQQQYQIIHHSFCSIGKQTWLKFNSRLSTVQPTCVKLFYFQIYNERFEEEKAGYTVKMEVYRKLKEEAEQLVLPSASQLNLSANSFMSNYDYEDSFD